MESIGELLAFIGSYSIVDFVPITGDGYLRLFERANNTLWPLPIFSLILSITLLCLAWQSRWPVSNPVKRTLCLGFTASWLSVAYIFHWCLLGELTVAGQIFALLFAIQGFLFLMPHKSNSPYPKPQALEIRWAKVLLIAVVIIYPALPWLSEHTWQSREWFAIAPDPSCLMTLGLFFTKRLWPWWITIIPLLWCVISGLLALAMGLISAWLPLSAAAISTALLLYQQIQQT